MHTHAMYVTVRNTIVVFISAAIFRIWLQVYIQPGYTTCKIRGVAEFRRARAYRIAEVCREKMEGSMKTLRKAFTGDEEKETDYVRQVSQGHVPRCEPTCVCVLQAFDGFSCLSWKQKVIGFVISIVLAATFAILVSRVW